MPSRIFTAEEEESAPDYKAPKGQADALIRG